MDDLITHHQMQTLIYLFPIPVLGTHYEVKIHTPEMGWTRTHLPAGVVVENDHNSYNMCNWFLPKRTLAR